MEDLSQKFGAGSSQTILHPLVLVAMVIVILVLLVAPRRQAIIAFLCGAMLIPLGQEILVGGVHVFVYRFIVVAGLLRMVRFKQTPLFAGKWNSVDTAFSVAVVSHAIAFTLLYKDSGAVVNQLGFIWDYLGGYIVLRYAIGNKEEVVTAVRCLAALVIIFAACMIREQFTDENIFGLLGGVRLVCEIRNGHVRSEAVFQHAILAGSFGATVLPLFVILWKYARSKALAVIAVLSSTVMVLTTTCSTPLIAYGGGIFGIMMWPARRFMRMVRWGLVIGLLTLHLVMHAPVWYLIAHVGVVQGSSTDHRAELIDTLINHVSEWWLIGTANNGSWGYEMLDTSNQYVEWGVTGGLFSLICFIATISRAFGRVGKARKSVEGSDPRSEWLLWLLGSALFANVVAYFGISYFDQTKVGWFALLAMVSAATVQGPRPERAGEAETHDVTPYPTPAVEKPMWA